MSMFVFTFLVAFFFVLLNGRPNDLRLLASCELEEREAADGH